MWDLKSIKAYELEYENLEKDNREKNKKIDINIGKSVSFYARKIYNEFANLFFMRQLIEKYKKKNKILYRVYVDLEKA